MTARYDLIVIGEGIAGLACARRAARSGLRVATLEENLFGGLVINVNELDGYPGAESGTALASELKQETLDAGVTGVSAGASAVRRRGGELEVATSDGDCVARAVVIATGARLRKLGVPGEAEFEGRGVSTCADCDAPMFQNEDVVVVGGGDSALQEALVLAGFCRTVHVVHRGERLRAQAHLVERAHANPKIRFLWHTTVQAILGGKMVESVKLRREGNEETLPCAGVFAYVGLEPNAAVAPADIARDVEGRLLTDASLETAMQNVWAIGAVRSGYSGLLRDAADEGERAAQAVAERLA